MQLLKKSAIFLMASFLAACADGLPIFPADEVYVARPDTLQCSRHKIISKDPVKIDKGEWIPWEQCPHVFGFKDSDIGPVMNWIRNSQETARKRCK